MLRAVADLEFAAVAPRDLVGVHELADAGGGLGRCEDVDFLPRLLIDPSADDLPDDAEPAGGVDDEDLLGALGVVVLHDCHALGEERLGVAAEVRNGHALDVEDGEHAAARRRVRHAPHELRREEVVPHEQVDAEAPIPQRRQVDVAHLLVVDHVAVASTPAAEMWVVALNIVEVRLRLVEHVVDTLLLAPLRRDVPPPRGLCQRRAALDELNGDGLLAGLVRCQKSMRGKRQRPGPHLLGAAQLIAHEGVDREEQRGGGDAKLPLGAHEAENQGAQEEYGHGNHGGACQQPRRPVALAAVDGIACGPQQLSRDGADEVGDARRALGGGELLGADVQLSSKARAHDFLGDFSTVFEGFLQLFERNRA
mmetsp:Transcript_985/g.2713  ORF Transcript_985/g.2713 Transcript_985/m.2713 type:complete len:367 (-) Transcript_985:256-1356(-)